jgi:hypothetical protein
MDCQAPPPLETATGLTEVLVPNCQNVSASRYLTTGRPSAESALALEGVALSRGSARRSDMAVSGPPWFGPPRV